MVGIDDTCEPDAGACALRSALAVAARAADSSGEKLFTVHNNGSDKCVSHSPYDFYRLRLIAHTPNIRILKVRRA